MQKLIIETPRLILRHWRESDLEAMTAINQDPKVMEFLVPKSKEETQKFIQANIKNLEKFGYCLYPVELKQTQELIGWVGLNYTDFPAAFTPAIEIGWRLGSQYWGNGYASEAALAVRDYAFNNLGIKELVSFTVPENKRSIKLMQRLGFSSDPINNFRHPMIETGHRLSEHVLYKLRATDEQE
jgi:RimJ/RimL family protein N-acetyltransferase